MPPPALLRARTCASVWCGVSPQQQQAQDSGRLGVRARKQLYACTLRAYRLAVCWVGRQASKTQLHAEAKLLKPPHPPADTVAAVLQLLLASRLPLGSSQDQQLIACAVPSFKLGTSKLLVLAVSCFCWCLKGFPPAGKWTAGAKRNPAVDCDSTHWVHPAEEGSVVSCCVHSLQPG